LNHHKNFLFGIFKSENSKWANGVIQQRNEKLNKIKTKWIAEMKLNKEILNDEDYLSVFNKERHEEIRDGASSNMMGGKKQKVHKDSRRLDDKDWD